MRLGVGLKVAGRRVGAGVAYDGCVGRVVRGGGTRSVIAILTEETIMPGPLFVYELPVEKVGLLKVTRGVPVVGNDGSV